MRRLFLFTFSSFIIVGISIAETRSISKFSFDQAASKIRSGKEEKKPSVFESTKIKAEEGDAESQFMLGAMYQFGKHVFADETSAAYWYQKSAQQGYPKAQFNLGVLYSNESSSLYSEIDAANWYEEAALNGMTQAQMYTGLNYYHGSGVGSDYIKSYAWLHVAAVRGMNKAREHMAVIAGSLKKDQVERSVKLAGTYLDQIRVNVAKNRKRWK